MKAIELTGIDYYCQVTDVELIKKIVRLLPEKPVCINIGAGMGTSSLAMIEARVDSHVFSIDIEKCPEETQALIDSGIPFRTRYLFIQGQSQKVGKWITKEWADFVFIDGDHEYEACYEDAIVWYGVLKTGGYMAFHDYESNVGKIGQQVKRAVDNAIRILPNLRFYAREGTMIVFQKVDNHEDIPDANP